VIKLDPLFRFCGECWEKPKRSGKALNSKKGVEVEEKRREGRDKLGSCVLNMTKHRTVSLKVCQ